jgi:peroxiredoxin (alkyl hydroperoxide reductase subunit C)
MCKRAGGPILPTVEAIALDNSSVPSQEVNKMLAQVGKEAIDFEATAIINGVGFEPVKLSDFIDKWVVLCFYPGDFTFV